MRILHTSDLHLNKEKGHTLDALKCLIETCKNESVNLLTIGGDLFHRPHDVEQLRTELRRIFSGLDFDVISISGNHDEIAYYSEPGLWRPEDGYSITVRGNPIR